VTNSLPWFGIKHLMRILYGSRKGICR